MSSRPLAALAALVPLTVLIAACSERRAETAPVGARAAVRVPFELYGHPGPWWRNNAMQADFDAEVAECRAESRRARQAAPSAERKDAAYRAFLDCMTDRGWKRGYPVGVAAAAG